MTTKRVLVLVLLAAVAAAQVFVRPRPRGGEHRIQMGEDLPPTCEPGGVFVKTDTNRIYACTAPNAWVQISGAGSSGGGFSVIAETPAGTLNGSNRDFTLAYTPVGGVCLYVNGLRMKEGLDYTLSGKTITFTAPATPKPGDVLLADYNY